jgi:hypothetical protein
LTANTNLLNIEKEEAKANTLNEDCVIIEVLKMISVAYNIPLELTDKP